jgi:hypothetical protein
VDSVRVPGKKMSADMGGVHSKSFSKKFVIPFFLGYNDQRALRCVRSKNPCLKLEYGAFTIYLQFFASSKTASD